MSVNELENQLLTITTTVTLALIVYSGTFSIALLYFSNPFNDNTQVLLFTFQRITLKFFPIFLTSIQEKAVEDVLCSKHEGSN